MKKPKLLITKLSKTKLTNYKFLTDPEVLPEKLLTKKAATIKKFELKKQTVIAKKQNQGLDKVYEFDGTKSKDDKKPTLTSIKSQI